MIGKVRRFHWKGGVSVAKGRDEYKKFSKMQITFSKTIVINSSKLIRIWGLVITSLLKYGKKPIGKFQIFFVMKEKSPSQSR